MAMPDRQKQTLLCNRHSLYLEQYVQTYSLHLLIRAGNPRAAFLWFGGHSTGKTPDPIPNSAVKCRHANGTASQDVGE